MSQYNDHDPLTVLHSGDVPVPPDPEFAARLRARLESALSLPNRTGEVVMSGTDTAIAELNDAAAAAVTVPRSAALPYLTVADARAAIDWYVDALGATLVGDPIVMDDGRIGHAELALAGGTLYLADEYPELGLRAPAPQAASVSLMLAVADTDAALQRARDRGAVVQQDAREAHGSRNATIVDPFGHRWMLSGPITGAAVGIQHGDVGYVSVWTPDADRAAAFYGRVLGWRLRPAEPPGDQHPRAHRAVLGARDPDDVLLLRRRRPRRRPAGHRRRRRPGRTEPGVRLRHRRGRDRPGWRGVRGVPAEARSGPARRSMALGPANSRTSPTRSPMRRRSRPSTAGCCSGRSSRAGWTTAGVSRTRIRWRASRAAATAT